MADDGDARDDHLSGLLEVEPLDEVTRRRLVTNAMRAAVQPDIRSGTKPDTRSGTKPDTRSGTKPDTRSARRLVAAAVIVVAVFGAGIGYLASRDGNDTAPVANRENSARTPAGGASSKAAGPALPTSAPSSQGTASAFADAASSPPPDAGDFGDLRVATNVDRLRGALAALGGSVSAADEGSDRVPSILEQLAARSCASELPQGRIVAVATGRFATRGAIVVQTELPDGTRSIDAVVAHPCEVRPLD